MSSFTKDEFPNADFTVITGDNVSLHVHRTILEIASPFFKDLFTLPQPKSEHTIIDKDKAIDKVIEDAETMRRMFSLIYPVDCESFLKSASLAGLIRVLRTSVKYSVDHAISRMSGLLIERLKTNPSDSLVVFAVGCVEQLPDLYSAASAASLNLGMSQLVGAFPKKQSRKLSNQQHQQTEDTSSTETEILTDLLNQLPFQEHQALLNFHRQRFVDIKRIIDKSPMTIWNCYCKERGLNVDTFKKRALAEIDANGPVSKTICSTEFVLEVAPNTQNCTCLSELQRGGARKDIEMMRASIDELPQAISLSEV